MSTYYLKTLYTHRDLLFAWTIRIIRGRYQQSVLGGLWSIIQPAAAVAIFSIIFTIFVPVNTGDTPYIIFSYVAMVPWTLFSTSITDMVESLVGNINLVTKIYFPREILPLSALIARLLDFLIAFCVTVILIVYFGIQVYFVGWLFLPVILTVQLALALGIGLIAAALNVFYRDVRYIFALGMQIWFYASPIIYPVSVVKDHFPSIYFLYYLNPMTGVLEAYRSVLLRQELPDSYLLISVVVSIFFLVIGYWFFKRVEFQFADVV
jgi:lipopolysaccharide transport system permease protein